MILHHECITFWILGEAVHLYSEEMEYGHSTAAEVGDQLHYLGNELPNITSSIFAWEQLKGRSMTKEELCQVLSDNHILTNS